MYFVRVTPKTKIRFIEIKDANGDLVRVGAAQGHSGEAQAQLDESQYLVRARLDDGRVQSVMVHGTSRGHAASIAAEGLKPGGKRGMGYRTHGIFWCRLEKLGIFNGISC